MTEQEAIERIKMHMDWNLSKPTQEALDMGIKALEQQSFFNPKMETAVETRNVYEQGYMRGYQDGLDKGHEWLVEALQKIVERLEDKHTELQDGRINLANKSLIDESTRRLTQLLLEKQLTMREAIDVVKEEGGLNA